jgi:hypothetical protein
MGSLSASLPSEDAEGGFSATVPKRMALEPALRVVEAALSD